MITIDNQLLSYSISRLTEMGLVNYWLKKYKKPRTCEKSGTKGVTNPVTMTDIYPLLTCNNLN